MEELFNASKHQTFFNPSNEAMPHSREQCPYEFVKNQRVTLSCLNREDVIMNTQ